MIAPTKLLLTLALATSALAQSALPPPIPRHTPKPAKPVKPQFDPNLILLDPAHGTSDPGARLGPNLLEKDANLAFARRLQTLLQARGFTVQFTREADPPPPPAPDPTQPTPPQPPSQVTPDQRAEQANRLHPAACLILHTTASGHGVHLYTSSLTAPSAYSESRQIPLWDAAQAPTLPQSQRLSADLAQSLLAQTVPLLIGRASLQPLDSMTCPAVLLELAPLTTSVLDASYQQHVAEALTAGLLLWRTHAQADLAAQAAALEKLNPAKPTPNAPEKFEKPKPKVPIIRRPPPPTPITEAPTR